MLGDDRRGFAAEVRQGGGRGGRAGALLSDHFGVGSETGYSSLGRLRVTVERIEEPDASAS